jgi:esterase
VLTDLERDDYDEFGFLHLYARRAGILIASEPAVRREEVRVRDDQKLSVLVWGEGEPELVILHGGGQNAHTWDSVALALARPLIALDLPGHGQSFRHRDRDYWPWSNAEVVAEALDQLASKPLGVVGMSLGGLTAIRLAAVYPSLVGSTVVVDVTPSVHERELSPQQRGVSSLITGAQTFGSFSELVEAAVSASGGRSRESLVIGARHNSYRRQDGRWTWRYDRLRTPDDPPLDFSPLWADVEAMRCPTMLVRGGDSLHVPNAHAEEFQRRLPGARLEVVPDAHHSVQSDKPVELAGLIEDFIFGGGS